MIFSYSAAEILSARVLVKFRERQEEYPSLGFAPDI